MKKGYGGNRFERKLMRDCVYDGAKNLFLISKRWPGRLHVVHRLLPHLKNFSLEGLYTEDIIEQRRRVGYRVVKLNGKSRILAKEDFPFPKRVGRFYVDMQTLEEFINPTIENALKHADILLLGQIGRIEILSPQFRKLILDVLDSRLKFITTLPNYPVKFLSELRNRSDVCLVEITRDNESLWPTAIARTFLKNRINAA
jgi:nucleoside-triphosphatase